MQDRPSRSLSRHTLFFTEEATGQHDRENYPSNWAYFEIHSVVFY
jgi:hypothetical protein